MNNVKINLQLEMGFCNDSSMDVEVFVDDTRVYNIVDNLSSTVDLELSVTWPTVLTFRLHGKDKNKDTTIDKDGNIVENKFVKLAKLNVNGVPLLEKNLYQISNFNNQNEIFWDLNGTATVEFTHKTPLRWLLFLNNTIYFRD